MKALVRAVDGLGDTIQKATNETTSSGPFDEKDSESIVTAINDLIPGLEKVVTDLDNKVHYLFYVLTTSSFVADGI